MLKPIAFFKAKNSAETIQAEATTAAAIMTGQNGIAMKTNRIPGAVEKKRGRASSQ